ncbi:KH domain-containing protein At4g18375 [Ziziphus jujuba]|uniref:KH domain-containing protein At4g18375 n=1 Tax=Ziziphus jujuba TaxID=326968 RepID=A0A6P3ZNM4_ZIZJJ|nr:KH domain-containing protein At4g18375 [Ziziphus jujuba]
MDGGKQNFFKTRPSFQFKRKGGNKRGKWNSSSREPSSGNSQPGDTVYRILCPSRKIGGVIGKGGNIVKTLREATQAKITVADSVPGSDERVIIINSSPTRISSKQSTDEDSAENNEQVPMQLHCAAQDALLKVHDRIVEEDLFGGVTFDDDNDNNVVTARLLVPTNMVGCLLGKRGDVIQRLRSKTGASIRILPAELLPSCAMSTDELVQISGKPDVAKKALYEVSTLLHQNPRKDNPPPNFPLPYGGQGYPPPGTPMPNMLPPGNPMWPHRNSSSHGMPPITWTGGFGNQPSGFMPACINGGPTGRGGEASTEFSMKILCSAEKIGGVIGKGGFNVKQLQQETGAIIHVQDASPEADERVICVSAVEVLWSPRSQIIEAVLQLQNKTSEFSEKGGITTRLLVPSSKVGCILGQGGHVINEMRRRTQADIRVYSKEEKPKCAAEDEELVQISGNFGVAKDALAEIASRLRIRTLRDANAGAEHTPIGPAQGFGPARGLPSGPPLPRSVGFRGSNGYDPLEVGREYEPPSYPVPPAAPGYPNANCTLEGKIATNAVGPIIGLGGRSISNFGEVGGARVKLLDSQSDGSE